MDKESFDTLVEAFESAGCDVRSYSGRGMYGRACLGVVTEENPAAFAIGLAMGLLENYEKEEVAELLQVLDSPETDSMGNDTIVYWPRVKWMSGVRFAVEGSVGDSWSRDHVGPADDTLFDTREEAEDAMLYLLEVDALAGDGWTRETLRVVEVRP